MRFSVLACALAASLLVCVSAVSPDTFDDAALSGVYWGVSVGGSLGNEASAFWTFAFDGAGSYTNAGTWADFSVSSQEASGGGSYAVAADGGISFFPGTGGELSGGLGQAAGAAVFGDVDTQAGQEIGLLAPWAGDKAVADLAGTWYWAGYMAVAGDRASGLGTFVFNEAGSYTCTVDVSAFVAGPVADVPGSGTAAAAGGGAFLLTGFPDDPGQSVSAGLSADNRLLVLANTDEAADIQAGAMVRAGGGHTLASLQGKYRMVSYGTPDGGITRQAFLGSMTFDGAGGFTVTGTLSDSLLGGDLDKSGSGAYTLDSRGLGTLDFDSGKSLALAVSADASFALAARTHSAQEFAVLVKTADVEPSSPKTGQVPDDPSTPSSPVSAVSEETTGCFVRSAR
ncbi:MAG: hypothetical protein JRI97_10745 [Deltaproteobacteria bacterium]|nr:hypothetical protein [Deltaproteobacteria bacterium]